MTKEKYYEVINASMTEASGSPEWNAMFELSLLKSGLKIVTDVDFKSTYYKDMTPVPVDGLYYSYPYPSYIVEV